MATNRMRITSNAGHVTRVLIADDHALVRQGIRSIVESAPGYEVCGEAVDGAEAIWQVLRINPDVLILDLNMPVLDGMDAARAIRRERPNLAIVMVSIHTHYFEIAKKMGVHGYISKSNASEQLMDAIAAVSAGQTYFSV